MKKVLKATAIVAGITAVAGVAYATYKYFTDDWNPCHCICDGCDDDYDDDDDFEDDFDDDFFEDEPPVKTEEKEEVEENPVHIKVN